jgi:hypothetical protein
MTATPMRRKISITSAALFVVEGLENDKLMREGPGTP